jgi:hypothetical protein
MRESSFVNLPISDILVAKRLPNACSFVNDRLPPLHPGFGIDLTNRFSCNLMIRPEFKDRPPCTELPGE